MFPIDLDDIDLMMMAKECGEKVFVAPVVIPQNREFRSQKESNSYNSSRNDFFNYALSCVSFWEQWKYNPLLNWNRGYTGNANKPGRIHSAEIKEKFQNHNKTDFRSTLNAKNGTHSCVCHFFAVPLQPIIE